MMRTVGRMTTLALAFCGYTSVRRMQRQRRREHASIDEPGLDRHRRLRAAAAPAAATINTASYNITGPNGFTQERHHRRVELEHADRHHRRAARRHGLPDHASPP